MKLTHLFSAATVYVALLTLGLAQDHSEAASSKLVNLALKQRARQSSTGYGGDAARAVDGNTDGNFGNGSVTHTEGEKEGWWEVDLGQVQAITEVRLWNRTNGYGERLSNFILLVSTQPFASNSLDDALQNPRIWKSAHPGAVGTTEVMPVNTSGRYVRVQLRGANYLSLAEVQVMGPGGGAAPAQGGTLINLALKKAARQSSTGYSGDAARAVDGNTDGNFGNGSVTHTEGEKEGWWEVDLGQVQAINEVRLWNRTDACGERLANFYVLVSAQPFASNSLDAALQDPGVWKEARPEAAGATMVIPVNASGRYVRVQLRGTNYLSLAEVQVMGLSGSILSTASIPAAGASQTSAASTASSVAPNNAEDIYPARVSPEPPTSHSVHLDIPGGGGTISLTPAMEKLLSDASGDTVDTGQAPVDQHSVPFLSGSDFVPGPKTIQFTPPDGFQSGQDLGGSFYLTLPLDDNLLKGATSSNVGAICGTGDWTDFVPGLLNRDKRTVTIQTNHLSFWTPSREQKAKEMLNYFKKQSNVIAKHAEDYVNGKTGDVILEGVGQFLEENHLDMTTAGKILGTITKQKASLKKMYEGASTKDVEGAALSTQLLIGRIIAENVPESRMAGLLNDLTNQPDMVADAAQAAGSFSGGDYFKTSETVGRMIWKHSSIGKTIDTAISTETAAWDLLIQNQYEAAYTKYKEHGSDGLVRMFGGPSAYVSAKFFPGKSPSDEEVTAKMAELFEAAKQREEAASIEQAKLEKMYALFQKMENDGGSTGVIFDLRHKMAQSGFDGESDVFDRFMNLTRRIQRDLLALGVEPWNAGRTLTSGNPELSPDAQALLAALGQGGMSAYNAKLAEIARAHLPNKASKPGIKLGQANAAAAAAKAAGATGGQTAVYDPYKGQGDNIHVTISGVENFKQQDAPGWKNNGTSFNATAKAGVAISIQGSIVTKPWSYFDFANNIIIKGDGQVLLQQQPPIPKEGGSASFSYNFDPGKYPNVRSLSIEVSSRGGNPDFANHWVGGTIQINQ